MSLYFCTVSIYVFRLHARVSSALLSLFAEFICYDDGCHLKKYATNSDRKSITPTAAQLVTMNIVVDKLHFQGHVDKWCQENCNPYKFEELKTVSI